MTCALPSATAVPRMSRRGWRHIGPCPAVLTFFIAIAGSAPLAQEAPPGWPAIAALFVERCVMCHSGEHAAVELHLDSYEGATTGSKNGPVLIPGDAASSELMRRVLGESQPRMPFLGYPLEADEIALLEYWIEAGLPEGETVSATKTLPAPALAEESNK
ncbi:c-type cytochrome domain-containing protein [Devosia nitrariae]|uniref:Cytochrome C Planctomycete-type domain-containing protein n=1 Tax=Devosia nitrariae TaxID=2071872 RepID=A0ABQ5VZ69_9HYPH|nr:c-type cytochrome domain-containing protein [Devosia nitrariae]GLQ52748.1 hypothetical protein GCM10010862_00060 [Devosia nitrariae]